MRTDDGVLDDNLLVGLVSLPRWIRSLAGIEIDIFPTERVLALDRRK
jgi:hypothetical protein